MAETGPAPFPVPASYPVPGLSAPVEIIVDTWGVPHLYASSREDVFVAQGFNAARDRLFQIDLWRRRGTGQLAEVLGASYLEQDRASRLFAYRGDEAAEWAAYGDAVEQTVTAFVCGVNAYVEWVREHPAALPPEFALHGYLPAFWEPFDAVRFRTHGLFYNVEQELARALTLHGFGAEAEELRQAREPADPLTVPEGIDLGLLASVGEDVLRVYRLAFAPVGFDGRAAVEGWRESISGSNNWVVSGSRTSTGRPILANDPHRAVTLPGLRYLAHLEAPGVSVIGAGEPGLPGISIGHNGRIAFGLTIWPADHEDLYVYELDPSDASRYRYGDGWEAFRVETEAVAVAGSAPVEVELVFTRHGPVIYVDAARGFAVAVRAVWLEPGMAPYVASLGYLGARDGEEFVAALESWGAPGVNQIFAAPDGDFGWQASALIPHRPNWDGSLPVPGDGRYEWSGFSRAGELPSCRRPERGWIATANQENLPPEWANENLTVTYDWYSFARQERLAAWLAQDDAVSVESSVRMQSDELSVHALRVRDLLAAVEPASVRDAGEWAAIRDWDGRMAAGSRTALVFEVWLRRHLRPWLVRQHLRAEGLEPDAIEASLGRLLKDESFGGDLRGELRMLGAFDDAARLTAGVDETLHAALAELDDLLAGPRADWTWGALHHSGMSNPALAGPGGAPPEWARVGPAPRGGSGDTVGMAGYDAAFRQSIGSTFRMVIDVGEWDSSRAMNAPGQSGDPRSSHYRDLFEPWLAGDSFPLAYSRAAVESVAAERITLRPAGEHREAG